MRGNRLWIVLRGVEDRCIAVACIKRVERYSEGYYANDFLLTCDTATSFRLSSSFEDAKPYVFADFRDLGIGVNRVTEKTASDLKDLALKNLQIKLIAPPDIVLKRVKLDIVPKKGKGLAKAALSQITQSLPLDQIWASGTGNKLGPFSHFASSLLSLCGYDASEVTAFLKAGDPTSLLIRTAASGSAPSREPSVRSTEKSVDLDFTEIDPKTIYAREFVLSEGTLSDLESALNKTEAAEKLHQDMLRDISSYLEEAGIMPYESGSIDLMISSHDRVKIFEIKSSTPLNIVAQAAKGAFQMACYVNAMENDYLLLSSALILHKIGDEGLERFVHEALSRLGVEYLTYDPDKKWPDRINGLLN